jgi:hypothetical protein
LASEAESRLSGWEILNIFSQPGIFLNESSDSAYGRNYGKLGWEIPTVYDGEKAFFRPPESA